MKKCGFLIESLNASRAVEKLVRAGVEVLGAEKSQKNAVTVWVDGKDCKKVFAIFPRPWYNVTKLRAKGWERVRQICTGSVGLLVGAALFCGVVCFMQSRVLRVDVVGSGAYYEAQVREILSEGGLTLFGAPPKEVAAVKAGILALPRVNFCSVKLSGGIYTVTVEVSDEQQPLGFSPLCAPKGGVIEELVALRGTPVVAVGDTVEAGAVVVQPYAPSGEGTRPVLVIARVVVGYPVEREYALAKAQALSQAFLDFGELRDATAEQTATGWKVSGYARATASVNLE